MKKQLVKENGEVLGVCETNLPDSTGIWAWFTEDGKRKMGFRCSLCACPKDLKDIMFTQGRDQKDNVIFSYPFFD